VKILVEFIDILEVGENPPHIPFLGGAEERNLAG
jgi:hypothetical protein